MLSSPGRYLALLLLCAAVALPLRSQEAPSDRPSTSEQKSKKTSPADKSPLPGPMPSADGKMPDLNKIDFSALPADAVVIVCESVAEGLRRVPDAVILSAKRYQELREEIERLKKMLQAEKAVPPSKCHLKGKVEGNTALVQAQFEGATDRPNAVVALACRQAWASDARIDGRTPLIRRTEADGFFVQIEKPGNYHVTLELIVPLPATPSNIRNFELTLPGAAITTLELDLPSNVKDVSASGHPLNDPTSHGLTLNNHHLRGTPDRIDKLDLAWKEVRPPSGVPVLTSEGNIQVRLDSAGQTTEADLLLKVEGEQRNVWRLLVPLRAEVKVLPPGDSRVQSIEKVDQPFASLRTIHLKEPSADPLPVRITVHAPLPQGGSLAPVGPFLVLGATRQTGTLRVRNQVRDLHLDYHGHGDLQLQRLTDEPGAEPVRVAVFTYSNIPLVEKPRGATGPASLSWLDLEAAIVRSQVRTRMQHALILQPVPPPAPGTAGDALRWDVLTTIEPVSKWPDVEQFKIVVPPEWMPAEEGITVGTEKDVRFVTFRRSELREKASQPVQLRGYYQPSHKSEGHAILRLPRPQGIVQQCTVTIQGPGDSEVVLNNAEQADLELVNQTRPNEQSWRFRRVPADGPGIDIAWKPYRPELQVKSVVDVTLNGGRADVRHEMRLHSPRSLPASITLRVPPALGDSLKVLAGGRLEAPRQEPPANPKRVLRLEVPAQADGTDGRLVLHYTTTLGETGEPPPPGEPFGVPLVVPSQATQGETKVRVWGEPGFLPLPSGGSTWEQRAIEEVEGRADLPALVLHTSRVDASLALRAAEQAPVFTVLAERALVRVQLLESGGQSYRASFQLRQLAGRYLDVELPGPVPTLSVRITLNQRTVTPDIVNDRGEHTDGGSIARLRLGPDLVRQAALLDVFYQVSPGRAAASPLHTTLQPPLLRGAPATVPTRWQVTLPSNRVLIAPESASGLERTWGRDRWLLAAHLNRTNADLEREFEQSLPAALRLGGERFDNPTATPALVCWQDALEPIALTYAPQQAWLLVCSLGLLVLGLGLYWSARPQPGDAGQMAPWFWPMLALLTLAVAVGVLLWPTALWAVVYGCEPGAVVLLGVIGLQWLMHQRYRRQIVFLPSFSRTPASSSLLRKSSSHRPPPGEPSTVDAPPPANSST